MSLRRAAPWALALILASPGLAQATTLEEAIAAALAHAPEIAAAEAEAEAAEGRLQQARSAFAPSLSLNGTVGQGRLDPTAFFGLDAADVTPRAAQLTLEQPLFTGGRATAGIARARADMAAAEAGGEAVLSPEGTYDVRPDVAVVVFGETPYAEFQGDVDTLDFVPTEPLETLKRLKAAGVPTVSVFLSGRPMWTNPEINASDAFVAAWLPGTEGAGVADVLIGDQAGKPRNDFTGTLSFSWPKDATGTPLNHGQPGYDPQFAYGYGLTYAAPARVGMLSEESGVSAQATNLDRYFVDGRFVSPWSLLLNDAGGQTRPGTAKTTTSPRAGVASRPVDDLAQESGQQFAFAGTGPASVEIWGTPVDLTRQANGAVALGFRYRVDVAPSAPVAFKLGGGAVDLTGLLRSAPVGQWREARIPLTCFRTDGGDLSRVEVPFHMATSGAMTVSVSEIKLDASQTETRCPA
jgi:beta-glucosidase